MSRRKQVRTTAFTRLLLFLVLALPTIFFGVSYARGEDPMATIKSWFGQEATTTTPANTQTNSETTFDASQRIKDLQQEIKNLNKRLENKDRRIDELSKEVEALKAGQ